MPLFVLIITKRKINFELILFLLFSIISTILLAITRAMKINNLAFFNSYLFIAISCLACYFFRQLSTKSLKLIVLITLIVGFTIFFWELNKSAYVELIVIYESICFILWSLLFMFEKILTKEQSSPILQSHLIINSAFFLYNTSSLFLIFYISIIMANNLWYIHNFIEGSSKLLIAYAFWKLPKTSHY